MDPLTLLEKAEKEVVAVIKSKTKSTLRKRDPKQADSIDKSASTSSLQDEAIALIKTLRSASKQEAALKILRAIKDMQ